MKLVISVPQQPYLPQAHTVDAGVFSGAETSTKWEPDTKGWAVEKPL